MHSVSLHVYCTNTRCAHRVQHTDRCTTDVGADNHVILTVHACYGVALFLASLKGSIKIDAFSLKVNWEKMIFYSNGNRVKCDISP